MKRAHLKRATSINLPVETVNVFPTLGHVMGLLIVKMVVTSSIANRLKRARKKTNSVLMTLRAKISPAPIGEEKSKSRSAKRMVMLR